MAFDGTVTRAIAHELHHKLATGRITKIYQPSASEIVLTIRAYGNNHRLMISCHPVYARVHITTASFENPAEPPMFCMLLRKQLEAGRIERIEQVAMERVIHITIQGRNELGDLTEQLLVIELMGRHSNVILLDKQSGKIIDAMRRVGFQTSQYRQVLPGMNYVAPPDQGKLNPLTVDRDTFIANLDYNSGQLHKQLVNHYMGLSPLVAEELIHRATLGDRESLWHTFALWQQMMQNHNYQPEIVKTNKRPQFTVLPLTHLAGERQTFATVNECVDTFFTSRAERDRISQQTQALVQTLSREVAKNKRKINRLQQELANSTEADIAKLYGELLTTYAHQVKRGQTKVTVINYYDGQEVTIPLNPTLSPNENAQRFYKKYQKLKASKSYNEEQIAIAAEENAYLETILAQLELANLAEVEQIREELAEEGWIKTPSKKRRSKATQPKPTTYIASDGTTILVGKNNKQNDRLTHHIAHKTDTWLHTKNIPGSHVVIRGQNISETALHEAALLAAYFSKARESNQVPVDYTLVKNVKKPSGARPGFVIYTEQKTLYVTPEEQRIQEIIKQTSNV
jgi:predicted ribosome quality control (RQC) complex YloA/Tae2 family protein